VACTDLISLQIQATHVPCVRVRDALPELVASARTRSTCASYSPSRTGSASGVPLPRWFQPFITEQEISLQIDEIAEAWRVCAPIWRGPGRQRRRSTWSRARGVARTYIGARG